MTTRLWVCAWAAALAINGCATQGGRQTVADQPPAYHHRPHLRVTRGLASFYARKFQGERTASGALHDGDDLTAAHRTLPFGTRVRVTNLDNDRSVIVVVNDRGPHVKGRIIDLSRRAARELGFLDRGLARVKIEVRPPER